MIEHTDSVEPRSGQPSTAPVIVFFPKRSTDTNSSKSNSPNRSRAGLVPLPTTININGAWPFEVRDERREGREVGE